MDSGTLRLWILLLGVVVIAGIYGWGKFQERRTRRGERIEPEVGSFRNVVDEEEWEVIPVLKDRREPTAPTSAAALDSLELADRPRTSTPERTRAAERPPPPKPTPAPQPPKELILTLSVLAPRGRQFQGGDLARALREAGMVYGAMKIFHAPADFERPDGPALFSLANVLEPGTLEPERLRLLETPGVVLFAQLPGPVKGIEVFAHMQATGRFLARELGGELCDERRQPLSMQKVEEIQSRILSDIGDTVRKPDL